MTAAAITALSYQDAQARLPELAELLHACVQDGASISFVLPFSVTEAEIFWTTKVFPSLRAGGTILLIAEAEADGRVAGSVQLDHDTPPNQPHRAEVRKLLVHPDFRRRGIGKALMADLENRAKEMGRRLLTLDTRTGDKAEPLYASMGYETAGIIPDFCRDTVSDRLDPTTIMYKAIRA